MGNPLKKVFEFILTSGSSKAISIIVILIIAAAIPLTVFISQQQQETRQHAATTLKISGDVFIDSNGNRVKDSGESNYAGATVKLRSKSSISTCSTYGDIRTAISSSSSPGYSFTGLAEPAEEVDYYVLLTLPSGYTITNPTTAALCSGSDYYIVETLTTQDGTRNWGIKSVPPTDIPAVLHVYSEDEVGLITGVAITGTQAGTGGSTTYTITSSNPISTTLTAPSTEASGKLYSTWWGCDSHNDTSHTCTISVAVGNTDYVTVDYASATPTPTPTTDPNTYTISGNVFIDSDEDGIKDADESNYAGATVKLRVENSLYRNCDNSPLIGTATSSSSSPGYSFPGQQETEEGEDYYIILTVPSGYTLTTTGYPNCSGNDYYLLLTSLNSTATVNFGIKSVPPTDIPSSSCTNGTVSGTVWRDDNWSGTQDEGESGFSSSQQLLQLYNKTTGTTTMTSPNGGSYQYTGLSTLPGTDYYQLNFYTPEGYYRTTTNGGIDNRFNLISPNCDRVENFGVSTSSAPPCTSGEQYTACEPDADTCNGSGTQSLTYTTRPDGQACAQVTIPDLLCTINQDPPPNNCTDPNVCVDLACVVPTVTQTPTPTITPTPESSCPLKNRGDANCDGSINLLDFNIWRDEFLRVADTTSSNFDGSTEANPITLLDFNIWRDGFLDPSLQH